MAALSMRQVGACLTGVKDSAHSQFVDAVYEQRGPFGDPEGTKKVLRRKNLNTT